MQTSLQVKLPLQQGAMAAFAAMAFQNSSSIFPSLANFTCNFLKPHDNCNQFAFPRVIQNIGLPLYVALLAQTYKSQNATSALFQLRL